MPAAPAFISPLRVSPNGRCFTDPAGRPVFFLGDTQWELFRLCTPDAALRVLKDRQSKGFNAQLIMLMGTELNRFDPKAASAPDVFNLQGLRPWLDDDPLKPNEPYFRHVDSIIRLGESTNQTFIVGVYHMWHESTITLAKARPWARWVASRYRSVPNLIWCMYPRPTPAFIPVCRELAAGLREGDAGAHLISCHPDPSPASSSFIHDEPWLAFNMIQTSVKYDLIVPMVAADYLRTPPKPVVMAEGGYEGFNFGRVQTPHHIRKQAYWTQLAGGHHVYGHKAFWKAPMTATDLLDSPGSRYLKTFRDIITALDEWWRLLPDQSVFLSGQGESYSLNVAARHPESRWLLLYLSEPSTVKVRFDSLAPGDLRASFIDPRTADRIPACATAAPGRRRAVAGCAPNEFTTPPTWQDALLLLETK